MRAKETYHESSIDSRRIREYRERLRRDELNTPSRQIALALLRAHLLGTKTS